MGNDGVLLKGMCAGQRVIRQEKPKEAAQTPEQLCEDRADEEYFRLSTEGDCRDVVRCDRAGIAGAIRLAAVRCPAGLAFDVERQTCDWKAKVSNCDKLDRELHCTCSVASFAQQHG